MSRRGYLDWLRGVAVLIMVEAHLFDAWVRVADRSERPYRWAIVVGGFSAPLFLFLAGVAMALATGSRLRKGLEDVEAAAIARRRGWQILGLAFLFRLQSFIISGGPFPQTLLKVDILNVMGFAMVLAAVLWGIASRNVWRGAALVIVALVACDGDSSRQSSGRGHDAAVPTSVVFHSRRWLRGVHAVSVGWLPPRRCGHWDVA